VDHLKLFNEIIKIVTPINTNRAEATSLDQPLAETGLDSLDLLMIGIYLAEIYGVEEEVAKTMQPETVGDMINFMENHKTKTPTSVEEAIKGIQ
jgi:acyl carrier protein